MRLFEIRKDRLPRKAGKAILEYEGVELPRRDGNTIVIPNREDVELFKLSRDWNQFLMKFGRSVWFGGTDENPFLVRLDEVVFDQFVKLPNAFYSFLVPHLIRDLQEKFPRIKCRRQGDIFAFPLPYTWDSIREAFSICHWLYADFENLEKGETSLFGTRHTLNGTNGHFDGKFGLFGGIVNHIVGGTVTAPDHAPMILEGPHAVAQTANLYEPKEAD